MAEVKVKVDSGVVNTRKSKEYAQKSEAWAVGKVDGVDVPNTADQYHNNSKYYKEIAMSAAATATNMEYNAGQDALNSEAYAVGKRNGSDVTSGDPAYHNNSKYFAIEAWGYSGDAENAKIDAVSAKNAAASSKLDSEAYAVGKRNGSDVTSGDPAYHNNSKYYSGEASSSASSASSSASTASSKARDSEAYAVGKRGGVDVTSGDPTYHNNSKYYSTQAASSATAASGSATAAASSATAAAASASAIAATYDSTKTYAVGEYCLYNGGMYVCTTAITVAEAWTAAHWSAVKVGTELTALKEDFNDMRIIGESINPAYVSGYITTSGTFGNGDTRTGFLQFNGQYVTIIPKNTFSRIAEYTGTSVGTFSKFIAKDRISSSFTFKPDNNKYYVIDAFPVGGGSYDPQTCPVDIITYYNSSDTDTSLTMEGKAADAKTVGDRFIAETNKSTNNIRSQQRSNVLFDMQSGHGFYNPLGSGDAPADDTTDYIYGTQSVKFNYAGKASFSPMDVSNSVIDVVLKVNSIDSGASINMYITDDNTLQNYCVTSLYKSVPANQFETGIWASVSIAIGASRIVGTPDLTSAKYIQFGVAGGTANYNIQSIGYRNKGKQKPCVTFTFDDGWSEVMLGAKVLGKYNIPATAYIFTGCELTTGQLLSLKNDYGWDIELHGDSVFTEMTQENLATYIQTQQDFVKNNGLGDGLHMAYPGGQNNRDVVNVVRRFCKTARTVNSEAQSIETISCPMPYNLRAISGIGASGASVSTVKSAIDKAVACNGWVILVFHRIGDTATSMFCSESDLEEIAEYAVASGADIKTINDMWERN